MRTAREAVAAFVTKDGSTIRELAHPGPTGRSSLAEATVPPGRATTRHRHDRTEEIYHVTAGAGTMELDGDHFAVRAGDTIRIAPGTPHKLVNDGAQPLVVLCVCVPPYSDEDTVLLE